MGVGKEGRGGLRHHLDFENLSKKGCFLSFKQEKRNFTNFSPPLKKFCNNLVVDPP